MTPAAVEFDPFSADFFDDPYDTYRALRDHAPVYHNARYGFWALSRFDDVVAAHQDWRTFSSAHGVTLHDLLGPPPPPMGTIIYLDPPQHERLRNLVSRAFTPRAIAALEPMIRHIVRATLDAVRGRTEFDAVTFVLLLGAAGSETVTKLIGNGVVLFHRCPAQWAKVVSDVGRIPSAVEEILRYWAPSQYQGRFTTAPATFHGVTIPAGVPTLLLTGAASRDERAYPDPDRFDIDRRQQIALGFGYGIHSCLGAALARLERRIAFEELRARCPRYRVDERGLRRVHMANVAGFSHVPLAVDGRA